MAEQLAAGPRPWVTLAVLLLLAVGLFRLWQLPGLVVYNLIYDSAIPWAAGLRLRDGLWPNLDYPSPFGPVFALLAAGGMAIAGETIHALRATDALATLLGVGLTLIAGRGQSDAARAAILLAIGAVGLAQGSIDPPWFDLKYNSTYNRWAWALLGPVVMFAVAHRPEDRPAALATGTAAALLLFLKGNYALAAALLILARLLADGRIETWPRRILWLALPGLLALGLSLGTGHFQAYLQDLAETSRITFVSPWGKLAAYRVAILEQQRAQSLAPALMLLLMLPALLWLRRPRAALLLALSTLALVAASAFNSIEMELVYPAALGVGILARVRVLHLPPPRRSLLLAAGFPGAYAMILLPLATARVLLWSPLSWADPRSVSFAPAGAPGEDWMLGPPPIALPPGAVDVLPAQLGAENREIAALLGPGITGRILSFVQPEIPALFHPALRPVPGVPLFWQKDGTFTPEVLPPVAPMLQAADWVLAPAGDHDVGDGGLAWRLLRPALAPALSLERRSARFELWRVRQD